MLVISYMKVMDSKLPLVKQRERFKETQREDPQPGTVAGEDTKSMGKGREREVALWI